ALSETERSLLALPSDDAPDDAVEVARNMDQSELEGWITVSDRLLARPSFLERLSPSRWVATWRRRSLLKQHGLDDSGALGEALHREQRLRPI
ncbi:hypothetical protein ACHWGL_31260, partial [Klebsiella pneumoniae]|uniref:hypothetical protein n=1 Tax=Klebsiella pneumoniae TaxID=573 RepID=UPI00376F1AFB